ncbi:MAG TPA: hypothetical protein VHG93_08945 [Longimicrobium sp.]|nr:hypothetical protein [Longimicrobium sp.]
MHRSMPSAVLACSLLLAACAGDSAAEARASDTAAPAEQPAAPVQEPGAAGGPPLGRYVCRQYTTTMGYLTLHPGGEYEVSGVRGRYRHDAATGAMEWQGGSYDEWNWEGTYEHVTRPADDGRPDEHVIRLVSESDGLKIDCYKMAAE